MIFYNRVRQKLDFQKIMAKKSSEKKITIDKLAEMVQKGFVGQTRAFNKRFDVIEKDISTLKTDVGVMKGDIKEIKYELNNVTRRTDKLEMRMDYVENVLNIPAEKQ